MSAAETLDARGLLCPLPVIRTQERIKTLARGTILDVIATDAGTLHDIPAWCRVHGHEVLCVAEEDSDDSSWGEIRIRLRVGG